MLDSSSTLYNPNISVKSLFERNNKQNKISTSKGSLQKSKLKTSFFPESLDNLLDKDEDEDLTISVNELSNQPKVLKKSKDSFYQSTSDLLKSYKESDDETESDDESDYENYDEQYTASLETLVDEDTKEAIKKQEQEKEREKQEQKKKKEEREFEFFTMKRFRSDTLWDKDKNPKQLKEKKETTADKMKNFQNEKKFCYLEKNDEISLGKETDFQNKYKIIKLINFDNQSCTYLTINQLYNDKMYLKQYYINNKTEYNILKIFKNEYKKICPKYFPCLKHAYQTDNFIYLAYSQNINQDSSQTLNELIKETVPIKIRKSIIKQLKQMVNNLLKLDIIHETSLDDIIYSEGNIYIINFNQDKAKIIKKESLFNKVKIKSNYKKWFKKNILSKIE